MSWFNIIKTRSDANTGGGSKRSRPTKKNRRRQDFEGRGRIPIAGFGGDDEGYGHPKSGTAGRKKEEDIILRPELDEEE
jgi:hypothetical protein|tara:strand:+ start:2019 stop:2255 length:237 start_codon:yes stop_codon:yes gene_type:complete